MNSNHLPILIHESMSYWELMDKENLTSSKVLEYLISAISFLFTDKFTINRSEFNSTLYVCFYDKSESSKSIRSISIS
jgi:hypothetical protein